MDDESVGRDQGECNADAEVRRRARLAANARAYAKRHPERVARRLAEYRATHREEIRAQRRKHRQENLEAMRAQARAKYAANREQARAKAAARYHAKLAEDPAWYRERARHFAPRTKRYRARRAAHIRAQIQLRKAADPERFRGYQRRYYQTHRTQATARAATRRARERGVTIRDFTHAQWIEMQAAYDHRCVYCGKRAKGHLTQDHLTPLALGGNHTASNIVPACRSCNCKKGTRAVLVPVQPLLITVA
jgi:5-methylcytosine-specific restriction endonuclease McrA